ncbi:MAG: glycosyltransferase family 2 protein [Coriobacteriales bacterium]|jgi:glycosyltransferase involved in cell wall biosynthesis
MPYDPLVSIIIPTHARPHMVDRAVRSALAQTYDRIEVVVIDDNPVGSVVRNSTTRILARMQRALPDGKMRLLRTGGEVGSGAARNQACAEARGEYLCFLDDDDEFLPDKVETQLAFMREHDLEMCYQDVAWYNEDGKLVELRRLDHARSMSYVDLLRAHMLTPISPSSIYMMTRGLFERTEGFGCTRTGQDWLLMLRCIECGARIGYMPGVHVHQLLHGDRLSVGASKVEGERERHEIVRRYYGLLSEDERRYVEFRHEAVLAVASKRAGNTGEMLAHGMRAVARAPITAIREAIRFLA